MMVGADDSVCPPGREACGCLVLISIIKGAVSLLGKLPLLYLKADPVVWLKTLGPGLTFVERRMAVMLRMLFSI